MNENSVVSLRQKDEIDDPLTEILRTGARRLITRAVESDAAEMEAWLSRAINYISDWSGNTAAGRSGAAGAETLRSTLDHLSRWNSLRHSHSPSESSFGESSNCKSKPSISCNVFPAIP